MELLQNVQVKAGWLKQKPLQRLFDILSSGGGEVMVNGGAVRNALMGEGASDVDLSTTLEPQEVITLLEAAGEKAVPTGVEHGTITAVIDKKSFEVTTMRQDIETDGRHAIVRFGQDWSEDAHRRDLTMNALYCDRDGKVFDPVGGYDDLVNREVRFIGDAATRIEEDALRILRFFRFFAWYGKGRPDAAGIKACASLRDLLAGLSVERIWMELKKLLSAAEPGRALLWMRTSGVLAKALPETEKWGIDAIPALIKLEQIHSWKVDPMLRLMAMLPPNSEIVTTLTKRLAMSTAERARLVDWAGSFVLDPDMAPVELEQALYKGRQSAIVDRMRLEIVRIHGEDEAAESAMLKSLQHASSWKRPGLPIKGRDLVEAGLSEGPALGKKLAEIENAWVESGFTLNREALLELI